MASDDSKRDLLGPLGGLSTGSKAKRKAEADAFTAGMVGINLDALSVHDDPGPTAAPEPASSDTPVADPAPQRAKNESAIPQVELQGHTQPELDLDDEPVLELALATAARQSEPAASLALANVAPGPDSKTASLEPVADAAHPPQNRRAPTSPHAAAGESAGPMLGSAPPPRGLTPTPAPPKRALFVGDPLANALIGAALGLAVLIFPAKKLAENYERQHVAPLIGELEGAIEHPLGVDAGLVEKPSTIAARIDEGREKTRRRFFGVWLIGAPLGLGLSQIPRVRVDD